MMPVCSNLQFSLQICDKFLKFTLAVNCYQYVINIENKENFSESFLCYKEIRISFTFLTSQWTMFRSKSEGLVRRALYQTTDFTRTVVISFRIFYKYGYFQIVIKKSNTHTHTHTHLFEPASCSKSIIIKKKENTHKTLFYMLRYVPL